MFKDIFSGVGKVFSAIFDFAETYPVATQIVTSAVASAFTPDEYDIMNEQERHRREAEDRKYRRIAENTNVEGVDIGMQPSGAKKLMSASGTPVYPMEIINQPSGLLNGARR